MDKKLLKLLKQKRKEIYIDPQSITLKFDRFLEENGVYHSLNQDSFRHSINGKKHLCKPTLEFYQEAVYDNEKLFLLDCLLHMGYDNNLLCKLALNEFTSRDHNDNLWGYADFLYSLKNYNFLNDYITIIMDRSYGDNREMLILLVGESKNQIVIPYLIELSHDSDVIGHVLSALSYFSDDRIIPIMQENAVHPQKWVSKIANKYLQKHRP